MTTNDEYALDETEPAWYPLLPDYEVLRPRQLAAEALDRPRRKPWADDDLPPRPR